jgi:enamine deaminase RidA (YjgF/YER057c/UK114 family)
MTSIYERLKNLQITLPGVPPVVDGYVAAFVPFVRTGNLIHLSGRLAKKNGKLWCGKLGEEITTAEGKQAARSVAMELLATLQAAIGDLNDVRRIVKLLVFVNSGPILRRPTWSPMALPNCSSKSLKSEDPMRAAPWACRRFHLVAALRSRWLWRHLYRKVHANCEMHTQKKQSGYEPKSFAVPGRTMMGA